MASVYKHPPVSAGLITMVTEEADTEGTYLIYEPNQLFLMPILDYVDRASVTSHIIFLKDFLGFLRSCDILFAACVSKIRL